jgi:hypothetical protein
MLYFAFAQRAIHDMPEAFYWIMIFLTFPTGLVIMYVFGVIIYVLTEIMGLDFGSSFTGLVFTWVFLVVGGHLQWFVLVPRVFDRTWKKFTSNRLSQLTGKKLPAAE